MLRRPALTMLPLLIAATPAVAAAQAAPARPTASAPAAALDAAARREVVAKLGEALRENYVFPEVGAQAAARIAASLAAGDYDALADPAAFTARLSADVDAIAHDKHLRIMSMNAPPPPPPPGAGPPPRGEAGVTRADRLAGGIGYIEVVGFPPLAVFRPVLDRAMAGLEGSRALIIDARRNGGGVPASVAYLVSTLLAPDRPVEINVIVSRVAKTSEFTREIHRSVPTPVSFAGVPVYVLTSKATFSGGEEFAYDVQALKRGTLVGEVTGGGANPVGGVPIGHNVLAMIPFGRAENPVTRTNWEGRGVQPDVVVPAGDALKVALERLGHQPVSEIAAASQQQVFTPRTTPRPGSEAALRAMIAGYVSGKPAYSIMAPQVTDWARGNLPRLQAMLAGLGELRSISFMQPDMLGGDQYEVSFARGRVIMALVLDPDGRILAASDPLPAPGQ